MNLLRDWWDRTKTVREIICAILILALIITFGYTRHVKQDYIDLCKQAGFDSGEGHHQECKCVTYTPYEGSGDEPTKPII